MSVITSLMTRMASANTLACCGLDPDVRRMPAETSFPKTREADHVYGFLREVTERAGPHVCAFKAQKAFFDNLAGGHEILTQIVADIHRDQPAVPVFVDCKVGDIDNTMRAYSEFLFTRIGADGILVNPYMGDDVLRALSEYPDRAIIVLARTSNPGASIIQDARMQDGRPLWQYVLQLITDRWNSNGNLIPVISATAGLDMAATRKLIPETMPVLLAGVGAQGGDYASLRALLNKERSGVFVNSSRALLYPANPDAMPWQEAVLRSVITFKEELNMAR